MGRLLGGLAVVVVVLLALDVAGVVPLVFSKQGPSEEDGSDLVGGEDPEGTVALHGTGREAEEEAEDPAPVPVEAEDASQVRGTRVNGGVIRGRVVQGNPPLPVPGVRVTLGRPDSIFSYLRAKVNGRFDQLEAQTDDEGRFAFLDLVPSKGYVVRALQPKFAVASSDKIDLRGGGEVSVGDLALGKGGQIKGRVVDGRGDPVPGANVVVTWVIVNALGSVLTETSELPEIEHAVTTDEDGVFFADRLEPGWKTVIVSAPNDASDAHPRIRIDDGKTFDVGDWKLDGTRFIGGKVLWSDGKPIPDVRVVAAPFGRPVGRQTLTGADGSFLLEHLPDAGNYAVGTMVPGLPVALSQNVKLDSKDLEIRIDTPARLHGRVIDAKSRKPVPSFRILTKQKPTGDFLKDMIANAVTTALGATPFEDPDGRFEFPRMAVGSFSLTVTAAGHPPHEQLVEIKVGDDKELVIEMPSGKRAAGRVIDAEGTAVANARVFVFGAGEVDKLDSRGLDRALTERMPGGHTTEDGAFTLPPQAPGSYDIVADADRKRPGVLKNVALGHDDVEGLEIEMPPSSSIAGHIVGPQGQRLREQVGIMAIFSDHTWQYVDTDGDGSFAYPRAPIGRVLLRWRFEVEQSVLNQLRSDDGDVATAAYEKLRAETEEHTLRNGQTLQATVTVPRRTLVKGVVMESGAPAKKVRGVYFLKQPEGQRWQYIHCDDGRFETRLVPGTYQAYIPRPRATGSRSGSRFQT